DHIPLLGKRDETGSLIRLRVVSEGVLLKGDLARQFHFQASCNAMRVRRWHRRGLTCYTTDGRADDQYNHESAERNHKNYQVSKFHSLNRSTRVQNLAAIQHSQSQYRCGQTSRDGTSLQLWPAGRRTGPV